MPTRRSLPCQPSLYSSIYYAEMSHTLNMVGEDLQHCLLMLCEEQASVSSGIDATHSAPCSRGDGESMSDER